MTLPSWYPASPRKPPIVGIYITHEDQPHSNYIAFAELYAVTQWLRTLTTQLGTPDPLDNDLVFEDGWRLSTREISQHNDLRALLARKLTPEEQEWSPPTELLQLFGITRQQHKHEKKDSTPDKLKKERSPRPSGLISLAEIAKDPREARSILRSKVTKPEGGWSWPKEQVEEIRGILRKASVALI